MLGQALGCGIAQTGNPVQVNRALMMAKTFRSGIRQGGQPAKIETTSVPAEGPSFFGGQLRQAIELKISLVLRKCPGDKTTDFCQPVEIQSSFMFCQRIGNTDIERSQAIENQRPIVSTLPLCSMFAQRCQPVQVDSASRSRQRSGVLVTQTAQPGQIEPGSP